MNDANARELPDRASYFFGFWLLLANRPKCDKELRGLDCPGTDNGAACGRPLLLDAEPGLKPPGPFGGGLSADDSTVDWWLGSAKVIAFGRFD